MPSHLNSYAQPSLVGAAARRRRRASAAKPSGSGSSRRAPGPSGGSSSSSARSGTARSDPSPAAPCRTTITSRSVHFSARRCRGPRSRPARRRTRPRGCRPRSCRTRAGGPRCGRRGGSASGSSGRPLGSAHETRTPSCSRRKSQCRARGVVLLDDEARLFLVRASCSGSGGDGLFGCCGLLVAGFLLAAAVPVGPASVRAGRSGVRLGSRFLRYSERGVLDGLVSSSSASCLLGFVGLYGLRRLGHRQSITQSAPQRDPSRSSPGRSVMLATSRSTPAGHSGTHGLARRSAGRRAVGRFRGPPVR